MSEIVELSLGVVLNDAREVLTVERALAEALEDGSTLSRAFPGGKPESGESSEAAVIREVLEETGFTIKPTVLIFRGRHPIAPVHVSYWGCSVEPVVPRQLVHDPKIVKSGWIAIESLQKHFTSPIHPDVQAYLDLS